MPCWRMAASGSCPTSSRSPLWVSSPPATTGRWSVNPSDSRPEARGHPATSLWLLSGTLLLATGCGDPAARPVPVEGTVTLEGQPVADGEVYFKTPGLVPEVLPVRDGRF